jgi:cytochrome c oxidase assembly protein subunit 15
MLKKIALVALCLACIVIVLGAYVRLSDAGLGCPDWPGCYGQLSPHHAANEISAATSVNPEGPVSMAKAWKEMVHRYLAASLGLLILAIAWLAWRRRMSKALPTALVGVVIFQGLLGKWTVTLLLKPAIVTGHLIGGLTTVALLAWLVFREFGLRVIEAPAPVVRLARIGLVLLAMQIVLGGWTSTNYAALACSDLPRCQGSWLPNMDFANAFHVVRELGMTANGDLLPFAALTAIHWTHRIGAMVVASALGALCFALLAYRNTRGYGVLLGAALLLQLTLGVANVHFSLPLPLAVAHNAGALCLLLVTLRINHAVRRFGVSPVFTRRNVSENAVA